MQYVLNHVESGIAEFTLNNPDAMNAMASGMIDELDRGIAAALKDPQVRCLIITGAGRGFCAGADLAGNALTDFGPGISKHIESHFNPLLLRLKESPKPVVCALNGVAAGAGVGLALACDLVIAATTARLILSFVRIGAVLDGGTSYMVHHLAGPMRARMMALLGEPVDAHTALAFGLVSQVVDDGALLVTARQVAGQLAAGPGEAMAMIKQQLTAASNGSYRDALALEARLQGRAFATDDFREGVAAFQERRTPRFGNGTESREA